MSGYLDWQVGDRVVCIADKPPSVPAEWPYPVNGGIYTIRELRDDAPYGGSSIVLLLREIDNGHMIGSSWGTKHCFVEPGYNIRGFRKVQPRKTDISIFTAMLHDNKEHVPG